MKHIFQPAALILVVGLSTNLLAGEFLPTEADPNITIKSIGLDPDNPKLLSVSVTIEAIGHGPVALAQDQLSVSISTQNEPHLFSSDAVFPATTAKTIKIEPDNPLTVTIKVDKNRFGMKESWSALQKGVYELQIRVNSGKSPDFDYQWLGQTYSKARKIKIPMAEQVVADEGKPKIPTLEVLSSIVGASASSKEFRDILKNYDFGENPKRENSWGSSFGAFFELNNGRVQVGIRPPSDATNMPTYSGNLPKELKAGDSIAEIREKLGAPLGTAHDPDGYYEMRFEGITVYTMRGKLFEIWLIPEKINKAESGPRE